MSAYKVKHIQDKYIYSKDVIYDNSPKIIKSKFIQSEIDFVSNVNMFDIFYSNSRFNIFSKEKVNHFYYSWLLNSIKGEKDNFVIGIIDENTKLLKSFLTYKIENERLIIGLLGTLGEYSRSGLAKILINDIEHIAISNKCKKILVSTQGHNTIANDFYTKLDFKISKVEHWYLNGG